MRRSLHVFIRTLGVEYLCPHPVKYCCRRQRVRRCSSPLHPPVFNSHTTASLRWGGWKLSRTVDAHGGGRVARFELIAGAAVDRGVLQEEGGIWNVVGCEEVVTELVTIRGKRGAGCAQNKAQLSIRSQGLKWQRLPWWTCGYCLIRPSCYNTRKCLLNRMAWSTFLPNSS